MRPISLTWTKHKAVSSGEDDNDNKKQAENEEDFGAQDQEEGCSGGTKKRRRFTLQEKLMYLWVIRWKVDKGLSLWEASKSINISHKQIVNWKKEAEKIQSKNNDRNPSTNPGAEPPRDAGDSGSARLNSMHLETSSSDRP